ncbi:hypothetical protein KSP40_PGU005657 [Platanthera guangdongensis]|uniref:Phytocyanin domain-containing protein n=1 Tax=Platanthera guangdongensis TaxID=2320717 RepID=A0ABR2LDP1_9ASPA
MKRHCVLAAVTVLLGFAQLTAAYDFYVGGAKGWAVKPEESYSVWDKKMRFQVNDKLDHDFVRKRRNTLNESEEGRIKILKMISVQAFVVEDNGLTVETFLKQLSFLCRAC